VIAHTPFRVANKQAGLSLIELMVGLAIGALLTLGLLQIFSASRVTLQMQEGLSRVQENGRFATQFLQRQLRMVGYMGCGADTGRIAQTSFVNHLALFDGSVPGGSRYRFQRPIEAFTAGAATPPAELAAVPFVANSDVLILRVFGDESVPVISIARDAMNLDIDIASSAPSFLPPSGSTTLFALQNCRSADVFAGTLTGTTLNVRGNVSPNVYLDPTVTACGSSACPWDFRISNATLNSKPLIGGPSLLNAEVHRAEYLALYVRNRPGTSIPGLYLTRFKRDGTALADAEELVEGVENMQLRFGYDTSAGANGDGTIDEYRTAAAVAAGAANPSALDANWRRVLSVRVALLIRSPDRAAVGTETRQFSLLGVTVTPPTDGSIRQVYETTIALRNRLFNT
jgi:type IV pilus assembly protein PilW